MTAEFVPTGIATADVPPGGLVVADVRGTRIAIANVGGTYYAFDDTCTHQQCSLADGDLAGTTVTCMCHGAEFDVRTEKCWRRRRPLRSRCTAFGSRLVRCRLRSDGCARHRRREHGRRDGGDYAA